jgi:hypothetical protein
VAVRRRGTDSTFITDPGNVGVEGHLYGNGPERIWRERNFSALEEAWPQMRLELISRGDCVGQSRDLVSVFLAFKHIEPENP